MKRPLPLPCSFLVDSQNRLVVMYKGPVEPAHIVADAHLANGDEASPWASLPFPGKWQFPPSGIRADRYIMLARAARKRKDLMESAGYLKAAAQQRPKSPVILHELAKTLTDLGEVEAAIEAYHRLLSLDTQLSTAWFNLANLFVQQERLEKAAEAYQRVLVADPADAEAHNRLGFVRVRQSDMRAAEEHFRQAVGADPQKADYRNNLGRVLFDQHKYAQAAAEYRAALKTKSAPVSAASNLAWILATCPDDDLRDGEEALRWATHCVRATRNQRADVLDKLAAAYAATGAFDRAVDTATQAIQRARAANQHKLATEIAKRRELYKQNIAYRLPR